jgi:hypothetical protein
MGRKRARTDITAEEVAEIYKRTMSNPLMVELMNFKIEEMLEKHPELEMSKLILAKRAKQKRGSDG